MGTDEQKRMPADLEAYAAKIRQQIRDGEALIRESKKQLEEINKHLKQVKDRKPEE